MGAADRRGNAGAGAAPDRQAASLRRWDQVMEARARGAVLWPLRPPHVLMGFFTLAANLGDPCAVTAARWSAAGPPCRAGGAAGPGRSGGPGLPGDGPDCRPGRAVRKPAAPVIPLTYLYAPYARDGYRRNRIAFCDIPAIGAGGPIGSALGGTGIAVSARTHHHPALCTRFALWLASAEVQLGLYAANNGQPGNARAWVMRR